MTEPKQTSRSQGGRADAGPRRPPRWVFKYIMNPLMTAILRSPFHDRVSEGLTLLSFTGRKSGKRISTPVGYHPSGQDFLVFTHSPWWKNFEGGAPATLRIRGKEVRGHAEAVRDPDAILTEVEPLLAKHGAAQARRMALTLDPDHEPTRDELRDAIQEQGLVLIRIRPSGAVGA